MTQQRSLSLHFHLKALCQETDTNPHMLLAIIRVYGVPAGSKGLLAETLFFFFSLSHCFLDFSFLPSSSQAQPGAVGVPLSQHCHI